MPAMMTPRFQPDAKRRMSLAPCALYTVASSFQSGVRILNKQLTFRSSRRACQPDSAVHPSEPRTVMSRTLLLTLIGAPICSAALILRSRMAASESCWEVRNRRLGSLVCIVLCELHCHGIAAINVGLLYDCWSWSRDSLIPLVMLCLYTHLSLLHNKATVTTQTGCSEGGIWSLCHSIYHNRVHQGQRLRRCNQPRSSVGSTRRGRVFTDQL